MWIRLLLFSWTIVSCLSEKDFTLQNDAALEAFVEEIYNVFQNKSKPENLKEFAELYPLTHVFREFGGETRRNLVEGEDEVKCTLCRAAIDSISYSLRHLPFNESFYTSVLEDICSLFHIENKRVCDGSIASNAVILYDIFRQKDDVDGRRFCAVALQTFNCKPDPNQFKWTVPIPEQTSTVDEKKPIKDGEKFKILHLSDIHIDFLYTPGAKAGPDCDEPICCQVDQRRTSNQQAKCGQWGEYDRSDPPKEAVLAVLNHANKTHKFDYVYYTGDIISHRVWDTSVLSNTLSIKSLLGFFKQTFTVPVYPVLGNHESHPLNEYAPVKIPQASLNTTWLFKLFADEITPWLPADQATKVRETILHGGFYTVSPRKGLRIIALNSNVCYTWNWWIIYDDDDQYGQLQWLISVLEQAEKDGESVHIIGHVPTGEECIPVWARAYEKIINRFAHTITGHFFGHTHRDQFHVYFNKTQEKQAVSVAYNGASITSYVDANPSYKIFEVDKQTFSLFDYQEWIFNLTEANLNLHPRFYKLYSFREAYGVGDLTPSEVGPLVFEMAKNQSLLDKYFRFKFRDGDPALSKGCDKECHILNLCEIVITVYGENHYCDEVKKLYGSSFSS